jgi:hypothetical protein
MEAEMKMVFQQKVQEKESKLKQSEEELYARHREMKEALEKQRLELEDKKRRIESGRPLTPEKGTVSYLVLRHGCKLIISKRNDSVSASRRYSGGILSNQTYLFFTRTTCFLAYLLYIALW